MHFVSAFDLKTLPLPAALVGIPPKMERVCPRRTPTCAAGWMSPVRLDPDLIRVAAVRCRPILSTSSSDSVVGSPQLPARCRPAFVPRRVLAITS